MLLEKSSGKLSSVTENSVHDVYVESIGPRGDGVAKVDGFVIFVIGGQKGKKYRVNIRKKLTTYAVGEIMSEL